MKAAELVEKELLPTYFVIRCAAPDVEFFAALLNEFLGNALIFYSVVSP